MSHKDAMAPRTWCGMARWWFSWAAPVRIWTFAGYTCQPI